MDREIEGSLTWRRGTKNLEKKLNFKIIFEKNIDCRIKQFESGSKLNFEKCVGDNQIIEVFNQST